VLNIEKSKIEKAGLGVFTYQDIPKNTLIGYYEGDLKEFTDECVGDYSFSLSDKYYINADKNIKCYIAMVNDTHNTKFIHNCEFRITETKNGKKLNEYERMISLWSIKNIKKYNELYADYGPDYWISR
jgi:hypothetical protein